MDVVVLRHGNGTAEKRFAVAPELELVFRGQNARQRNQPGESKADNLGHLQPAGEIVPQENQRDEKSDGRQVGVAVGHRLSANLH